jgi:nicotinamidase-related amidase
MNKEDTVLLVIDLQEKLVPAMDDEKRLLEKSNKAIKCFRALEIPIIVTQQYTKGIGETVALIKDEIPEFKYIEKTHLIVWKPKNSTKKCRGTKAKRL